MKVAYVTLLTLISLTVAGQNKNYSKDVATKDAIIAAIYDVISGDAQTDRDWERFKYLFTNDARLIPTGKNKEGQVVYRYWTPQEYIDMFTANRISFFERELARKTEEYGNIAHIFSTYETREEANGKVTNRGINSFQLLKSNDRWYIMNIFWSAESDGFPIPDKYLKN